MSKGFIAALLLIGGTLVSFFLFAQFAGPPELSEEQRLHLAFCWVEPQARTLEGMANKKYPWPLEAIPINRKFPAEKDTHAFRVHPKELDEIRQEDMFMAPVVLANSKVDIPKGTNIIIKDHIEADKKAWYEFSLEGSDERLYIPDDVWIWYNTPERNQARADAVASWLSPRRAELMAKSGLSNQWTYHKLASRAISEGWYNNYPDSCP